MVERVVEKPVPHLASGSAPANAPYRRPDFRCYYCFQETDGTRIPWNTRRPIKEVVDRYKESAAKPVTSSFGQLEECELEERVTCDVDIGKRTRSEKEPENSGAGKRSKSTKDAVMDVDVEDLLQKATAQKSKEPIKTGADFS